MASNLADLLERLSGYRHLFPPGTSRASANPVVFAFVKTRQGGQEISVLSRVCDAGLDYSQRSNKLAHHVVINETEQTETGPAWLLSQSGMLVDQWSGEPRKLESRRFDDYNLQPGVCAAWQAITGDAGWAGALIDSFHKGQNAFLILN